MFYTQSMIVFIGILIIVVLVFVSIKVYRMVGRVQLVLKGLEEKVDYGHKILKKNEAILWTIEKRDRRIGRNARLAYETVRSMQRYDQSSIKLYRQIEAAREIRNVIGDGFTKNLRGWALSPDALLEIFNYIDKYRPKVILELGSGYSTPAIAEYCKARDYDTEIIAIDHDDEFYKKTSSMVEQYDSVTLQKAPLRKYEEESDIYEWYNAGLIEKAVGKKKVDFIIVDGPPQTTNKLARYPVLRHLKQVFSKDYCIFVDDSDRKDESDMVKKWLEENPDLRAHYIPTEKGLYVVSTKKYS
jgi:hypothetical protein